MDRYTDKYLGGELLGTSVEVKVGVFLTEGRAFYRDLDAGDCGRHSRPFI
jgi:hypothetical protein